MGGVILLVFVSLYLLSTTLRWDIFWLQLIPSKILYILLLPLILLLQLGANLVLLFLGWIAIRLAPPLGIHTLILLTKWAMERLTRIILSILNLILRLFSNRTMQMNRVHTFNATIMKLQEKPQVLLQNEKSKSYHRIATGLTKVKDATNLLNTVARAVGSVTPRSSSIFNRYAQFIETAALGTQLAVFRRVQKQYPKGTKFVILPMNMSHMGEKLGTVQAGIDSQHSELLDLANAVNSEGKERIIFPFYTIHPKQANLREKIEDMRRGDIFINNNRRKKGKGKFCGLKIYPNLGYKPNDVNYPELDEIYGICEEYNVPIISHCTPFGIWQYGMTAPQRRRYGHPHNYREILRKHKNLRICLAHFGGSEEWIRRLRQPNKGGAWVHHIYNMITKDKFDNLYTDISYTISEPNVKGLIIDLIDYLKVMLESNRRVREHVLFGSDYYMIEQEKITEKEVSILLRSRLGDDLFFQIAYTNPRKFLGIT